MSVEGRNGGARRVAGDPGTTAGFADPRPDNFQGSRRQDTDFPCRPGVEKTPSLRRPSESTTVRKNAVFVDGHAGPADL